MLSLSTTLFHILLTFPIDIIGPELQSYEMLSEKLSITTSINEINGGRYVEVKNKPVKINSESDISFNFKIFNEEKHLKVGLQYFLFHYI